MADLEIQRGSGDGGRKELQAPSRTGRGDESDSDATAGSDEFDFVEREEQRDNEFTVPTPSYHFEGTWESAYNDTSKALKEVSAASKVYCNAIAKSGLAKAGLSIGGAVAATANRTALSVAGYAVGASRTDKAKLPTIMQNWLQGKERIDAAKKYAEAARYMRKLQRERIRIEGGEQAKGEAPSSKEPQEGDGVLVGQLTSDTKGSWADPPKTGTEKHDVVETCEMDKQHCGPVAIKAPLHKNPWVSTSPVEPSLVTGVLDSKSFKLGGPKASLPSGNKFKAFDMPEPVRRRLSETPFRMPPQQLPFRAKELSPYVNCDDDNSVLTFHSQSRTSPGQSRRHALSSRRSSRPAEFVETSVHYATPAAEGTEADEYREGTEDDGEGPMMDGIFDLE